MPVGGTQGRTQTQRWDPARYARTARFVAELGEPLLDLLAPKPGERVLDLGCGDGALTERLAGAGATVVGIDASAEQVAAARARGLDARVGDGQALEFHEEFDAVLSNAALHWMLRPEAAIDSVYRALRPGGRFVGEMGGHGNVATIADALIVALKRRGIDGHAAVPWYFPTSEEYEQKLTARGFAVDSIALIPRPTPLPGPLGDWLETFAEGFLNRVCDNEREAIVAEVTKELAPLLCDARGRWTADYVRLRFLARRPA